MRRLTNPDRLVTTVNTTLEGDQGGSSTYMAVVSPCSTCRNFTQGPQADPAAPQCPRRIWMDAARVFAATGDGVNPQSQLTASGTDDPDQLVNPAYDDDSQTIAVWTASLDNNPDILNPAFDTTHIRCDLYPVAPQESQAQFFSLGVFHESDQILVTTFTPYQRPDAQSPLVQIRGFARKVNFANSFTLATPTEDSFVSGT